MPSIPPEWGEPDSRLGVYYDILWIGLAVVGIVVLTSWEVFSITVSTTPQRLVGATIIGGTLGVAVTYGSFVSERTQQFWEDSRIRFASLFILIMGVQLGLYVAPAWTVLTLLASFLTLVPLRVAMALLKSYCSDILLLETSGR
jgi:hypothetical protein